MIKILKNYNLDNYFLIFVHISWNFNFLTFINEGFIPLNDENLQILLIIDILFINLLYLIFRNFYRLYYTGKK